MLCVSYRNRASAWVRPARQVTCGSLVLGSCSLPFLHFFHPAWGRLVSRNLFFLCLADVTVAGLGDAWSRANRQVLAPQLTTSIPNATDKFSRGCQRYKLQMNTTPPNPAGQAVLGTPPEGCALPVGPHNYPSQAHSPLSEGSLNAHPLFLLEGLSCIGDFQA